MNHTFTLVYRGITGQEYVLWTKATELGEANWFILAIFYVHTTEHLVSFSQMHCQVMFSQLLLLTLIPQSYEVTHSLKQEVGEKLEEKQFPS